MKKQKKENEIRPLTGDELLREELAYLDCKKPIKIGWAIFGVGAIAHFLTGLITGAVISDIPKQAPITDTLNSYRYEEKYNDYVTEIQKDAQNRLIEGEITMDEYNHIIDTVSSDKNFEEFLRSLKDDEHAKQIIAEYDEYAKQMNKIGNVYSTATISSLSAILISTLILAKYRFREMDIEEKRKKRKEYFENAENQPS